MKITVETMAEMVRAYAISVNVHKSVEVVADLSEWAYHYILNLYYEKKERIVEEKEVEHARNELYKEAMQAYKRAAV